MLVEPGRIERTRRRACAGAVVKRRAFVEQRLRDRAVEQAGVEVAQSVMGGEMLAERPLAGRGGPVDRDDHAISSPTGEGVVARKRGDGRGEPRIAHDNSPPSERISSTKPGKLVAMKAASSTCTG